MAICTLQVRTTYKVVVETLPTGTIFINPSTSASEPSTYIRLDKGIASLNGGYFWANDEIKAYFHDKDVYQVLRRGESIVVSNV